MFVFLPNDSCETICAAMPLSYRTTYSWDTRTFIMRSDILYYKSYLMSYQLGNISEASNKVQESICDSISDRCWDFGTHASYFLENTYNITHWYVCIIHISFSMIIICNKFKSDQYFNLALCRQKSFSICWKQSGDSTNLNAPFLYLFLS